MYFFELYAIYVPVASCAIANFGAKVRITLRQSYFKSKNKLRNQNQTLFHCANLWRQELKNNRGQRLLQVMCRFDKVGKEVQFRASEELNILCRCKSFRKYMYSTYNIFQRSKGLGTSWWSGWNHGIIKKWTDSFQQYQYWDISQVVGNQIFVSFVGLFSCIFADCMAYHECCKSIIEYWQEIE